MDADRLFLETVDDLAARTNAEASEYDLLRAAALLRELLIDGSPLIHQVNREPEKIGISFQVRAKAPEPDSTFEIWLGIGPDGPVEVPLVDVGLTDFIRIPVVFLPASRVTIGQVITLAANVRGGVHRGNARDPVHQAFEAFQLKVRHGAMPLELILIAEISKIVIAALDPLAVVAHRRSPGPTARIPIAAKVTIETMK